MSSRQEQKERRRKEREERERAERNAAKRKQLGQIVAGVVVVAAVVVGVVLAVSGGGSGGGAGSDDVQDGAAPNPLPIPAQSETDLQRAVAAAGCAFREFDNEGQDHVGDDLTAEAYDTNPPTSGPHNPIPATDGFYPAGDEPDLANSVHSLEHGRIQIQYSPRLPQQRVRQLQSLFNEDVDQAGERYHMMMFRNNTNMRYAVAAVAWTRYVVCNEVNNETFDALRIFRDTFVDQAPEQVP